MVGVERSAVVGSMVLARTQERRIEGQTAGSQGRATKKKLDNKAQWSNEGEDLFSKVGGGCDVVVN